MKMKAKWLGAAVLTLCLPAVQAAESGKDGGIHNAAQAVYKAKCASCHGKDVKGNPAMAKIFKVEPAKLDLISKDVQAKKDEEIKNAILKGKGKMPKYEGKLKEAEVDGLVSYIRSLAPPQVDAEKKE